MAQISAHLAENVHSRDVNVVSFARDTSHIDLNLGERLRQLAIHLECSIGVREWRVLGPIYAASLEADPRNADAWSSQAIARKHTGEDSPEALRECVASSRHAVALAPDDGHLWGHLGMSLYESDELEEAEVALRRSIELGHAGWPHLWLAHTLHDGKRWGEAAEAYASIPAGRLPSWAAWRIQLARQQRAACLLRTGRRPEAVALYAEVLERYERALAADMEWDASPVLQCGAPEYLREDLAALPELQERAKELLGQLDR
jgi:tetratricopeptide (TPR) repeat protein